MSDKSHEEELFGLRLVKDRVLTEAQLSTARDFQKAVGGSIGEVIVRLKLVDAAVMAPYLESDPGADKECSGAMAAAAAREDRRPTPPAAAAPADAAETAGKVSGFSETSIVLEALIRLLVKKGVITKAEIKNEVLQMDTADLVRNGVIVGGD